MIPPDVRRELALLVDEGVVEILPPPTRHHDPITGRELRNFFESNLHRLLHPVTARSLKLAEWDNIVAIHERYVGPVQVGAPFSIQFLRKYYSGLLAHALQQLAANRNVLLGSRFLHDLVLLQLQGESTPRNPTADRLAEADMACLIVEEGMLDASSLSLEQILELRTTLREQFEAFQDTLASLSHDMVRKYSITELRARGRELAGMRIRPLLRDVERKLDEVRTGALAAVLAEIKSLKSYIPFLGTALGIPPEFAAIMTGGIIAANAGLKARQLTRDVAVSGVAFLAEARRRYAPELIQTADSLSPSSPTYLQGHRFMWPSDLVRPNDVRQGVNRD